MTLAPPLKNAQVASAATSTLHAVAFNPNIVAGCLSGPAIGCIASPDLQLTSR